MSEPLSPADEGTIAHKLLEMCVRKGLCSPLEFVGKTITVKGDDKEHSMLSPSGAHRFLRCMGSIPKERRPREVKDIKAVVTREMANAVEVAVDYIRDIHDKMRKPVLKPEHEVWIDCLDYQDEDGHGTLDVLLFNDTDVHVVDYKHGQGEVVEADENEQTTLYAIGELNNGKHKGKKWHLHIAQPRAPHPDGPCRVWTTDEKQLRLFEKNVQKRVDDHDPDNPHYSAGKEQCRWCWRRTEGCKALAQEAISTAQLDFKDFVKGKKMSTPRAAELTSEELVNVMKGIDLLKLFVTSVEEAIFGRLQQDDVVTKKHFKLVEGRSNRKWKSEDTVMREFKKLGISVDLYAPRKLVGIGDGESIVPKQVRTRFMDKHTFKPIGKATIATIDDPRRAIKATSAIEDFEDHLE